MNWYIGVLKQYAVFSGRARRTEYWMFTLINILIMIGLSIIESVLGISSGLFSTIYSLGVLLPSLGVSVRRLHDTNRSGWWILLALIPLIGAIVLIIFMVQDSTPGENQFGSNPKGV